MNDLEKAERWLGVSGRSMVRTAQDAIEAGSPSDAQDAIRIGVQAVLLYLYAQRIRMSPQQKYEAKQRLTGHDK